MKWFLSLSFALVIVVSVGLSPAAAQVADSPGYAVRGPHPVGVFDFTAESGEHTLNATMWYPALNPDGEEESITYQLNGLETVGLALRDAIPDLESGPYPVIYYAHGLFGARFESTQYLEQLASWGFVVIAADHRGSTFFDVQSAEDVVRSFGYRPHEIMSLIAQSEMLNAEGSYAGLMEMDSLGISGWSFGGYTGLIVGGAPMDSEALAAVCAGAGAEANVLCEADNLQLLAETVGLEAVPSGVWPTVTDARIKAIVPLAPCCVEFSGEASLAGITAPLMVIVGTADESAPADLNGIPAYEGASSESKSLVLLEGAGHEAHLDIAANEATRDLIHHFATAFFLAQLKGDAKAAEALTPSAIHLEGVAFTATGS